MTDAPGNVTGRDRHMMIPKPTSVRYNDWRQVAVEPLDRFTPTLPVSVIIPYYRTPAETLARTLAALEGQTYPRDLFEVVIVDDGSQPPLERPRSTPLNVRVVRQERRGFGAPRARNTGARAAAHDILLFLDADMLAEAGWMAAHARWHHAVSDALTVGLYARVSGNDIDAETIRCRTGLLRELFSDRPVDPPWTESHLARTNNLTSKADDLFRVVVSGNLGVSKIFYKLMGGFDESFTRWGMEDTEFGYRAHTRGGLLVPVPDAFAWHQGRWKEDRDARDRNLWRQSGKTAHLIAHPGFRGKQPGRIFTVPQYVVTIDAGHRPVELVVKTTTNILADRVHDLVVRIETRASDDHERLTLLQDEFGQDPRVRVAPTRSALDEFPTSPFHVTLPAAVFAKDLVHRLRVRLGGAVIVASTLPDETIISITRAWVLHRARRTGGSVADFGEARTIPAALLKLKSTGPPGGLSHQVGYLAQLDAGHPQPRRRLAIPQGLGHCGAVAGGRQAVERLDDSQTHVRPVQRLAPSGSGAAGYVYAHPAR